MGQWRVLNVPLGRQSSASADGRSGAPSPGSKKSKGSFAGAAPPAGSGSHGAGTEGTRTWGRGRASDGLAGPETACWQGGAWAGPSLSVPFLPEPERTAGKDRGRSHLHASLEAVLGFGNHLCRLASARSRDRLAVTLPCPPEKAPPCQRRLPPGTWAVTFQTGSLCLVQPPEAP